MNRSEVKLKDFYVGQFVEVVDATYTYDPTRNDRIYERHLNKIYKVIGTVNNTVRLEGANPSCFFPWRLRPAEESLVGNLEWV